MTFWDLSHPIRTGMQVHPGDPAVRLEAALTIERDGVAVAALACGTHTGTHLDAPSHTVPGGRSVDALSVEELCGEALVVQVPEATPRQCLDLAALDGLPSALPPIVLVATGWDKRFGDPTYLDHPWLHADLVVDLQTRGMRVLGVDTLSPDETPRPGSDVEFAAHAAVLGADGIIVENLRGLTTLPQLVRVSLLPLPLAGADGSPIRAVAWA